MLNRVPLPFPSPRLSLLSIPISLLSLERRQRLPRLAIGRWRWLGLPLLAAGLGLAVWSEGTLRDRGEGTPDPSNPPRLLVVEGPYRYVRNPMWVARLLGLAGAALLLRSLLLLLYIPAHFVWMHLYIVQVEEPELHHRFGEQYEEYGRRVPRWLPRFGGLRRPAREPAAEEV